MDVNSLGLARPQGSEWHEAERDEQLLLGLGRADRLLQDLERVLARRRDRVVRVRDADRHNRCRHYIDPSIAANSEQVCGSATKRDPDKEHGWTQVFKKSEARWVSCLSRERLLFQRVPSSKNVFNSE